MVDEHNSHLLDDERTVCVALSADEAETSDCIAHLYCRNRSTYAVDLIHDGFGTGVFYRQFGLTMAMSIGLSAINALTLSPALCALFLKPHKKEDEKPTELAIEHTSGSTHE